MNVYKHVSHVDTAYFQQSTYEIHSNRHNLPFLSVIKTNIFVETNIFVDYQSKRWQKIKVKS